MFSFANVLLKINTFILIYALLLKLPRCSCADNQNFTWSPVPIPISWSPGQGPGTGPISWSPGQGPVSGTGPVSWSPGTVLPATGMDCIYIFVANLTF